ncbi:MAG TPA: glycosyltransferase [Chthonomonadaceae bacterium]|nr:glycosyltransferase [Chthonomonadaceae bacterium]
MRIVIATQNYFQPNNGQAVFVAHLAEGLASDGHQVLVMTPSDRRRAYTTTQGRVRVEAITALSLAPWYPDVYVTFRPQKEVARLLESFAPDIVHIQDHFPLCRSVVRAARQRRLPLIGTNHFLPENIIPFVPVLSRSARCRRWMERLLWRMVLRVFDKMGLATAPTETAAALLRRQGLVVPVYAVSCGVDLDTYRPDPSVDRAALRRRYGLSPDRPILFFVGRVDREKRLDVLIEALPQLEPAAAQLAIAGRGRDLAALQAQAQRLGLADRVVFVGFVPEADLPALLNSVDIFAMPSEAELLSLATLEAMATGLPVLAANARALPELVENGVNGYLFRAGDAGDAARRIDQLLCEQHRWGAMGAASLAKARAHSLQNTIRRYEELYHQTLALSAPALAANAPLANPPSSA